jgi:hypothetical protein
VILFVDNDVILKLTACDLFWEAIACLGSQDSEIRVLSSAKFVFERNKEVKKNYSEQVRQTAIATVKKLTQVNATPDNPFIAVDYKGLDQGELILIGAAIAEPCFYLVTGDKNCLRALMVCPDLEIAKHKLKGQVICLEQLIVKLIEDKGFDAIKEKVTPVRDCDKSLKVAFGSGPCSTEPNSLFALNDYIAEIERDCPNLLMQTGNMPETLGVSL